MWRGEGWVGGGGREGDHSLYTIGKQRVGGNNYYKLSLMR